MSLRIPTAVVLAGALIGLGLAAPPPASAQAGSPSGQPVVGYGTYPDPLPAGCPDGAAALEGVRFDNGRGGEEADLRRLDLRNGDVLSMTWDAFAPGCRTDLGEPAVLVSMAAYDAGAGTFDPSLDQRLLPGWTSCGAGGAACAVEGGRFRLSVVLPGTEVSCTIQTGAVLGLPLAVVGPSGSYYSAALRGDDRPTTLVGAANFATTPCPPPPSTPAPPAPPATAAPVVAAGALVAQPTSSTTAVAAAAAALPATGRGAGPLVLAGLGALAAGALLLALRRRVAT